MGPAFIGPYKIIEGLGSGANGEVFLAEDTRLGRKVAVKTLSALGSKELADARRWVLREARAAARLNHPNIASVYDVLESEEGAHIVMEYVPGETLAARLRHGTLPVSQVMEIGAQLADALAEAHGLGVIHRDLKPANVMLTPKGTVKVLDFGLAQVRSADPDSTPAGSGPYFTLEGRKIGTPPYMPPEHLMGDPIDARGDIYSLGVTLFELLTRRRPFQGADGAALAAAILTQPTPRVSGSNHTVPASLDSIVYRAMSRLPRDRYGSAVVLAADLRRASAGLEPAGPGAASDAPTHPHPFGSDVPTPAPPLGWSARLRSTRRVALLAGAGLIAVLGLAGFLARGRLTASPPAPSATVVAVLPLSGVGGEAQDESLATGIADSLISSLSRIPGLTVVSRQATLVYRDRKKDTAQIARDLGAGMVVDGALQRSGDKVRVSLSLLRPESSAVEWSHQYDGSFADVFTLQSAVGDAVADALRLKLSPDERREVGRAPTSNVEAFADYAQARSFLERPDVKENLERSLALFRAAVAKDPRFARAHAGLADALWRRFKVKGDMADAVAARDASAEALRLDAGDASVHYSLAKIYRDTGRVDASIEELKSALRIQPGNDEALSLLGQILAEKGDVEGGVREIHQAIRLRPDFWGHHYVLGLAFYQAGHFSKAVAAFGRVTQLQPDNSWGFQMLGTSYHALDDTGNAVANYRHAIGLGAAKAHSNLGLVYFTSGRYAEAARSYEAAIQLEPRSALKHRVLGDCYARLGQRGRAVDEYRRALQLSQEALQTNPRDASSLSMVAICEAKLGLHIDAERHALEAVTMGPATSEVLYRQAVVYALTGKPTEGLRVLEQAFARGYGANYARKDPDLETLWNRAEFTKLVALNESRSKNGEQR
jgi:TolB-like protein/Tfp pilus assembly protein PilF